jgi:hypothetical protein
MPDHEVNQAIERVVSRLRSMGATLIEDSVNTECFGNRTLILQTERGLSIRIVTDKGQPMHDFSLDGARWEDVHDVNRALARQGRVGDAELVASIDALASDAWRIADPYR